MRFIRLLTLSPQFPHKNRCNLLGLEGRILNALEARPVRLAPHQVGVPQRQGLLDLRLLGIAVVLLRECRVVRLEVVFQFAPQPLMLRVP